MSRDILLLHGWGAEGGSMELIAKEFADDHCTMPDLPGFGEEPEPSKSFDSMDYAAWVSEYCKNHNLRPDILIGHSNGGKVAIQLVAEGLVKPRLLVLIAPAIYHKEVPVWKKLLVTILKPFKFLSKYRFFKKLLFKTIGSPDYGKLNSPIMKETFRRLLKDSVISKLHQIDVPTVIFWGTNDKYTPFDHAHILHHLVFGSKLVPIEGKGHFIHKYQADFIAREVKKFMMEQNIN